MTNSNARILPSYSSASIALHWLIAALILTNVALALLWDPLMNSSDPAQKARAATMINFHMSFGLTVLVLSLVRLGNRLTQGFPALPDGMKPWERVLARATHYAFYVLMIGIPLAGYVMASASEFQKPISYFGLFGWPLLPIGFNKALDDRMGDIHALLAWSTMALLALHIAGALKHQLIHRDGVLARMLPRVLASR